MNQYILNLETGKIQLHFEYSDYQALSDELKAKIKSTFLWARSAGAWVSRTRKPNNWKAEAIAKDLNLEYKGEEGERLTFAEQKEKEQIKAEKRVEFFEARAEKAEGESQKQYERSHDLVSVIPMGQPILVGHHSERGHRSLLKKADNAMRKSCEADEKAKYYKGRAEASKAMAQGDRIMDEGYLVARIKEHRASVKQLERRLQGKFYVHSAPAPIAEIDRMRWEEMKAEATDKLDYFIGKLYELKDKTERGNKIIDNL